MRVTGKRCGHCGGNIVSTYDNRTHVRNYCLQCGRDANHKCDQRCVDIQRRDPVAPYEPYLHIEQALAAEVQA